MRMKQCGWLLGALTCVALGVSQTSANLLVNPGFEDPVTQDGPPFVGFWEVFNGGPGSSGANSNLMPRNGAQHLIVSISNTNNTFAGAFQDVTGLVSGQAGSFSVWQKAQSLPLDLDVEMRIEWRNAAGNNEVARTPNFVPTASITTDYQQFTVSGLVPAGADTARVVYAIQTFSGGAGNTGTLFVDDASFVVPEPATIGLFGIALVGSIGMRRHRRA